MKLSEAHLLTKNISMHSYPSLPCTRGWREPREASQGGELAEAVAHKPGQAESQLGQAAGNGEQGEPRPPVQLGVQCSSSWKLRDSSVNSVRQRKLQVNADL